MGRPFVGCTAVQIVLKCHQVMGTHGTGPDCDMEHYERDLLVIPIMGGSSTMQENHIASRLNLPE